MCWCTFIALKAYMALLMEGGPDSQLRLETWPSSRRAQVET
jgi:hypothetical protein